jgi:ornithine cyclodeaminase
MREADDALIRKSEIFVDSRETTIGHIGEIDIPLQEGTITKEDILGDYYDLCTGNVKRSSDTAITLLKNGGGAHLDLMTSLEIYRTLNKLT